jgi:hypothetical protein
MPIRPWLAISGLEDRSAADNLWDDGDQDWFLTKTADNVNDREASEVTALL